MRKLDRKLEDRQPKWACPSTAQSAELNEAIDAVDMASEGKAHLNVDRVTALALVSIARSLESIAADMNCATNER